METVTVNTRLPRDLYERLREAAFRRRTTHASMIREALARYLDALEAEKHEEERK